jgi:precorrin-6B methylase 2
MKIIEKVRNAYWESYFGIATRGIVASSKADSHHYATIDYHSIFTVLGRLRQLGGERLADVGCGKGRVLCCASYAGFQKAVGIEYDPAIAAMGRENLTRAGSRAKNTEIVCQSAETFDYTDFDSMYLFNPFRLETTQAFARHLAASNRRNKDLVIAYVLPDNVEAFALRRFDLIETTKPGDFIPDKSVAFIRLKSA